MRTFFSKPTTMGEALTVLLALQLSSQGLIPVVGGTGEPYGISRAVVEGAARVGGALNPPRSGNTDRDMRNMPALSQVTATPAPSFNLTPGVNYSNASVPTISYCENRAGINRYVRVVDYRLPMSNYHVDLIADINKPALVLSKCIKQCNKNDDGSTGRDLRCDSFDFVPGVKYMQNKMYTYTESKCLLAKLQNEDLVKDNSFSHLRKVCFRGSQTDSKPIMKCPGRLYVMERYLHLAFNPKTSHKLHTNDLRECEEQCLNQGFQPPTNASWICRAGSYNTSSRECILSPQTRRTDERFTKKNSIHSAYFENTCLSVEQRCPNKMSFIEEIKKEMGGPYDLLNIENITLEECKKSCMDSELIFCRSIEYDSSSKSCTLSDADSVTKLEFLKNTPSENKRYFEWKCIGGDSKHGESSKGEDNTQALQQRNSGVPVKTAFQLNRKSRLNVNSNSGFRQRDYEEHNLSLADCLNMCLTTQRMPCKSLAYSDSRSNCKISSQDTRDGNLVYDPDYDYYKNLMSSDGSSHNFGSGRSPGNSISGSFLSDSNINHNFGQGSAGQIGLTRPGINRFQGNDQSFGNSQSFGSSQSFNNDGSRRSNSQTGSFSSFDESSNIWNSNTGSVRDNNNQRSSTDRPSGSNNWFGNSGGSRGSSDIGGSRGNGDSNFIRTFSSSGSQSNLGSTRNGVGLSTNNRFFDSDRSTNSNTRLGSSGGSSFPSVSNSLHSNSRFGSSSGSSFPRNNNRHSGSRDRLPDLKGSSNERLFKIRPKSDEYNQEIEGAVSQKCHPDGSMEFRLRTNTPFRGRIYTYNYYNKCYYRGGGQTVNFLRISGPRGFPDCGTSVYDDTTSNIVMIQFAHDVITKMDRRYNLTCVNRGPSDSTVTSGYIGSDNIGPVPIEYLPGISDSQSRVNLQILYNGDPTTTVAVGDLLTFRIVAQDGTNLISDIFVSNVIARDPYTDRQVLLIDANGCPVDVYIFPALGRGRSGNTVETDFNAFMIPESSVVLFQADVRPCRRSCEPADCSINGGRQTIPSYGRRRRRSADDDDENESTTIRDLITDNEDINQSEPVLPEGVDLEEPLNHIQGVYSVYMNRDNIPDNLEQNLVVNDVCVSGGQYYSLLATIIVTLICFALSLCATFYLYRKQRTVKEKNAAADADNPRQVDQFANNPSQRVNFPGGDVRSINQSPRYLPQVSMSQNNISCDQEHHTSEGEVLDHSEPIYTNPSLFERA